MKRTRLHFFTLKENVLLAEYPAAGYPAKSVTGTTLSQTALHPRTP